MAEPSGQMVIVGAGGHAKVIIDLCRSAWPDLEIIGLTDLDGTPRLVNGLPVLGGDGQLDRLRAEDVRFAFVALGDNILRRQAADRLQALGYRLPSAVSPRASVSPSVKLGIGVAVMHGAVVNADALIGDLVIVNSGAVVEHDCRIGADTHLGPGSVVAGGVQIGARTLLGAGSTVIPGIRIGEDVVVGAGACVTRDLPSRSVVVGVPARALDEQKPR